MHRQRIATQLTYTQLRSLQISLVFTVTILIQLLWRYPRAGVTGFVLMLIYAGFDNGSTIARTYDRFVGTLYGLLLGYLLWYLGQLDNRMILLCVPVIVFGSYFFANHAFRLPTTFNVCGALVGTGYFAAYHMGNVRNLILHFFMCSIIAFGIILIFESLFFKRYNQMARFIQDSQTETLRNVFNLVSYINHPDTSRKRWLNECTKLIANLHETQKLLANSQFIIGSQQAHDKRFDVFFNLVSRLYASLKGLYFIRHCDHAPPEEHRALMAIINQDLQSLKTLIAIEPNVTSWDENSYVSAPLR